VARHPLLRRRVLHALAASVLVELLVDVGAVALAEILAPTVGEWVFAAAAVIVIGTAPVLVLNLARIIRRLPETPGDA
jgi:hypothetical protein